LPPANINEHWLAHVYTSKKQLGILWSKKAIKDLSPSRLADLQTIGDIFDAYTEQADYFHCYSFTKQLALNQACDFVANTQFTNVKSNYLSYVDKFINTYNLGLFPWPRIIREIEINPDRTTGLPHCPIDFDAQPTLSTLHK
jgi:hypothetical protein